MSYRYIIYEKMKELKNRVARITLNQPEKLNALSGALMNEFGKALEEAIRDSEVRVVIIRGAGRAFSAGYDIAWAPEREGSAAIGIYEDMQRMRGQVNLWLKIWDCPKPVIAQVHGWCLAGGTEVANMCDLIIAAEDAQFGYPPVRSLGVPPTFWFPWIVGLRKAKQLVF